MRVLLVAMVAALAACASAPSGEQPLGENPFPVARGSALPPPVAANAGPGRTAPPEGAGAAGLDFGRWRCADPAAYGPEFQARVRQRYAGQNATQIRADLEANGFLCENGQGLDCRIEIMERQCAIDWYVVVERGEPVAGYEVMCLGAR